VTAGMGTRARSYGKTASTCTTNRGGTGAAIEISRAPTAGLAALERAAPGFYVAPAQATARW